MRDQRCVMHRMGVSSVLNAEGLKSKHRARNTNRLFGEKRESHSDRLLH